MRTELTRDEVDAALVDGFFPEVGARRPAAQPPRRVGLQELGLPYAADPAVTRHLAAFVGRHRDVAPDGPTAVLFNGGVMQRGRLRERIVDVLDAWRGTGAACRVLAGADLDLAVARGAAYYGLARRGRACASAAARRARTTSASRPRCRRCPASRRR